MQVRAKHFVIGIVILLDETEGLVRIYHREWQCRAEENLPASTASGLIRYFSSELPSLESFRISASPTTSSALPARQSPPSVNNVFVSPHKRRKTADSSNHPGTSILGSPVVERSSFLAQYSPTSSHHTQSFQYRQGALDMPLRPLGL